ncbi:carbon storage regulator CsrA [Metaclostridioides mangenotii]|uniref:Translational regulator CsrA n=1 Tax=Metaclostridioides mangenotii TaxID=1540 RepID=A0ABS4ECJ7_9FIRM|nr:carbon storage regulator CsrA [Clostridioides mangenotii]MBP1855662.1 carbon storage regulator [Clostridioides mangenotii]
MLVISRKKDETILLGDDIEITVVSVDNNTVKLGISAPKDVSILRKEVYEKVKEENIKAINKKSNLSDLLK